MRVPIRRRPTVKQAMTYLRQFALSILTSVAALAQPQILDADLRTYTESSKVPALVAVVCSQDTIVALGATGVRRVGDTGKVSVNNRFNIGSNAKAMLATVIAMHVEEGKLNWDSKPADLLEIPRTNNSGPMKLRSSSF